MKTILIALLTIFTFSNLSIAQKLSNEDINKIFKSKYGFEKVEYSLNESKNFELLNSLNINEFLLSKMKVSDLQFSSVTKITWKDGVKTLEIKDKKNPNKFITFSIQGNDYKKLLNLIVVNNNVDMKGNGTINFSLLTSNYTYTFTDGKITNEDENGSNSAGKTKSCFRTCFDNAYDDICDGFLGCVAWHTNPGVPIAAAAYCSLSC